MTKTAEEFTADCQALGKNDPRHTHLNLGAYSSLLDPKRVQQLVRALEKNTFVEELTLSATLGVHSTLQFNHFLKTSPSLQRLVMFGGITDTDEDESKESIKASIVFESISRSSLLVKLTLCNVIFGDDCPLEGFLSSTRTLLELTFFQKYSTMSYQVAQAIGSGLAQNKSLVELCWVHLNKGVNFLEEVLFGLSDHLSLKTLTLGVHLTTTSSLVLRSLLHFNGTLETFTLIQLEEEKIPTMVSVLAGLAKNTGLKEFTAVADSSGTNATLAAAWTKMLERNTSITILDLREVEWCAGNLSLNRHGRMLLRLPEGTDPPSGLWPRVLAKITGPCDMSLLFYFLQNKPKIVNWNAPANRKRKASDSPSLE
jgi:hypothetical protein